MIMNQKANAATDAWIACAIILIACFVLIREMHSNGSYFEVNPTWFAIGNVLAAGFVVVSLTRLTWKSVRRVQPVAGRVELWLVTVSGSGSV